MHAFCQRKNQDAGDNFIDYLYLALPGCYLIHPGAVGMVANNSIDTATAISYKTGISKTGRGRYETFAKLCSRLHIVVPALAGIQYCQEVPGFRVKPGMTEKGYLQRFRYDHGLFETLARHLRGENHHAYRRVDANGGRHDQDSGRR